jgi:hypothetical protein
VAEHGGCRLGMPVQVDDRPGTGCRADCLHRAFVEQARDLIALDREQRNAELEEARWSDLDEGAERARKRPAITLKSILLDRRDQRLRAER